MTKALRKIILRKSKEGVSRAINSRRECLRDMRLYLLNPTTAPVKYLYYTIYKRGPEMLKEIEKLKIIRSELAQMK